MSKYTTDREHRIEVIGAYKGCDCPRKGKGRGTISQFQPNPVNPHHSCPCWHCIPTRQAFLRVWTEPREDTEAQVVLGSPEHPIVTRRAATL